MRISTHHDKEVDRELRLLRTTGIPPGVSLGLQAFNDRWTWKKGQSVLIYGAPGGGKSTLSNYLDVVVSYLHGWKHLIFTPEIGSIAEQHAHFAQIVLGQYDIKESTIPPDVWERALDWVYDHFRFCQDVESQEQLFVEAERLKKDEGYNADCITIDPFNKLRHQAGAAKDEYVQSWFSQFNEYAKASDRFHKLVIHPIKLEDKKVKVEMTSGEKEWHYPVAQKDQVMWGQEWDRQAWQMVSNWRPKHYKDENNQMVSQRDPFGMPYAQTYQEVHIQKVKQAATGRVSKNIVHYDWKTCRYYSEGNSHEDILQPLKQYIWNGTESVF
jgi:energy-coupling factor transporter ATP-binding protein EcfA2